MESAMTNYWGDHQNIFTTENFDTSWLDPIDTSWLDLLDEEKELFQRFEQSQNQDSLIKSVQTTEVVFNSNINNFASVPNTSSQSFYQPNISNNTHIVRQSSTEQFEEEVNKNGSSLTLSPNKYSLRPPLHINFTSYTHTSPREKKSTIQKSPSIPPSSPKRNIVSSFPSLSVTLSNIYGKGWLNFEEVSTEIRNAIKVNFNSRSFRRKYLSDWANEGKILSFRTSHFLYYGYGPNLDKSLELVSYSLPRIKKGIDGKGKMTAETIAKLMYLNQETLLRYLNVWRELKYILSIKEGDDIFYFYEEGKEETPNNPIVDVTRKFKRKREAETEVEEVAKRQKVEITNELPASKTNEIRTANNIAVKSHIPLMATFQQYPQLYSNWGAFLPLEMLMRQPPPVTVISSTPQEKRSTTTTTARTF